MIGLIIISVNAFTILSTILSIKLYIPGTISVTCTFVPPSTPNDFDKNPTIPQIAVITKIATIPQIIKFFPFSLSLSSENKNFTRPQKNAKNTAR
jgi:hypothetical protein